MAGSIRRSKDHSDNNPARVAPKCRRAHTASKWANTGSKYRWGNSECANSTCETKYWTRYWTNCWTTTCWTRCVTKYSTKCGTKC